MTKEKQDMTKAIQMTQERGKQSNVLKRKKTEKKQRTWQNGGTEKGEARKIRNMAKENYDKRNRGGNEQRKSRIKKMKSEKVKNLFAWQKKRNKNNKQ